MKLRSNKWYGWKRDLPDHRDKLFSYSGRVILEDHADMRPWCPHIWDQDALGSCTGFGIAGMMNILMRDKRPDPVKEFQPSPLFIYYCERVIEGTVNEDSGAMIRDGIKAVAKWGVCDIKTWPYDIKKFAVKPPLSAYTKAKKNTIDSYARVPQNELAIRTALSQGYPVVFGFSVYESFESKSVSKTGIVPMPKPNEALLGGHCVVLVGYDHPKRRFICRNSWGLKWGDKGYFYMPYEYILNPNLASDFWVIKVL